MLYTRKGDSGTSGLFGTKERFSKDSPIYEALGTLDELNSLLGVCHAYTLREKEGGVMADVIRNVQERLFVVQAELAGADKCITQTQVDELEKTVDRYEAQIENPHAFIIPGATGLSALLDYARAVSRRAERVVIGAHAPHEASAPTRAYLNRLSSLLYALARHVAGKAGAQEPAPTYKEV
ncbi:MAG: cob(I)yrinic acid a,c-diamide adenosyltransferase [bacterium]|nr:cob(I)yrinic acid a,c-diamide adenosyltransferase [bacterium]